MAPSGAQGANDRRRSEREGRGVTRYRLGDAIYIEHNSAGRLGYSDMMESSIGNQWAGLNVAEARFGEIEAAVVVHTEVIAAAAVTEDIATARAVGSRDGWVGPLNPCLDG